MNGPEPLGTVHALVCEDEPLARRAIREYLKGVNWVEIVGEAANGREAVRMIQKIEPDLIFLDVRMPGLTGLDVLDAITHRPAVVFTTAFDEYAVSAFELGAVDYLVKPFGRDRLLETLARVRVRLVGEGRVGHGMAGRAPARATDAGHIPSPSPSPSTRIFARRSGAIVPLAVEDIVRIDATTGGVELVTASDRFELDATLSEVEERLDPGDFVRVHRSHIVNLGHVVSIRRYDDRRLTVRLDDDSSLVASRQGSRALREIMG